MHGAASTCPDSNAGSGGSHNAEATGVEFDRTPTVIASVRWKAVNAFGPSIGAEGPFCSAAEQRHDRGTSMCLS